MIPNCIPAFQSSFENKIIKIFARKRLLVVIVALKESRDVREIREIKKCVDIYLRGNTCDLVLNHYDRANFITLSNIQLIYKLYPSRQLHVQS